ncbi:uncharacterized protein OCT59_009154 [Rhizophagus irregularis]|uniref:uncharacterized protein n=1 Tax=Rhizophagus irregularis TaxID=588596 RepID=UPI00331DEC74|nr:hypothetical protein OCT59_009154 [Rhizophagus irregularis]
MTSSWPLTSDFGNGRKVEFRSFEMMSFVWDICFVKSVSRNLVIQKMATDLRFVISSLNNFPQPLIIMDEFKDILTWLVGTSLQNFIFGEHMDFEFQISTAVRVTFDMGFICSSDLFGSFWTHSNLDLKVSVDYNQREFLSEELMAGVVLVWFKLNINYNEIFID